MKLYGTPPTRATRVLWLIQELGLECEVIKVSLLRGDHLTPEFLALNPAARLPVLVDGEVVLTESVAIALYLAEKCPEQGLIPTDLAQRAQMYRWLLYVVTEIEAPLERICRHNLLYPPEQKIPEAVNLAFKEGREMVALLEKHMLDREYLAGDRLSVADLVAAYTLDWANEEGMLEHAPRLREFVKTMYERPNAPPTIAAAFAALKGPSEQ